MTIHQRQRDMAMRIQALKASHQTVGEHTYELMAHINRIVRGDYTLAQAKFLAAQVAASDTSNPFIYDHVVSAVMHGYAVPQDYEKQRADGAKALKDKEDRFATLATTWEQVWQNARELGFAQ